MLCSVNVIYGIKQFKNPTAFVCSVSKGRALNTNINFYQYHPLPFSLAIIVYAQVCIVALQHVLFFVFFFSTSLFLLSPQDPG